MKTNNKQPQQQGSQTVDQSTHYRNSSTNSDNRYSQRNSKIELQNFKEQHRLTALNKDSWIFDYTDNTAEVYSEIPNEPEHFRRRWR